ncbi:protein-glutamate methylesterase/protein-glutamine glutaminase [Alteribacillus iranensis]|uniref:Protein-glutamate methylesterase/protein-glutamine glutaminase n=1 Tax=Alteribacillus iranensis TaxID=930128 RepID=A0A1I2A3L9_9BACI|nr:chemotaxis response regulator protein-glutamate methylesterase [Alteribacillus iranensis]SFE38635.1 two-component system, chemotaxis family, response regulator CheB [Alteribacillus iranensis]
MIRVLVVDDSAFMRKLISDFINDTPGMTAAATARNGKEAIETLKKGNFDVVTLDVEMPVMDGIHALRVIMKEHPTPVVMVSSLTREGASKTMEALHAGAVDIILKPSGAISLDLHKVKEEMISKIKMAAGVSIQKQFRSMSGNDRHRKDFKLKRYVNPKKVLAIGTSTGGPKALQHIIPRIDDRLQAPIFVAQHMPPNFTYSLAERLNKESRIFVKEAVDGELAIKGTAYIAPGGKQMEVQSVGDELYIKVSSPKKHHVHSPSVDLLLSSLADITGYVMVGLILTGMGRDGADGLRQLKENKDSIAVIESENSAIVYGMPKAAKEKVDIDYIYSLEEIPHFLNEMFTSPSA